MIIIKYWADSIIMLMGPGGNQHLNKLYIYNNNNKYGECVVTHSKPPCKRLPCDYYLEVP